MTEEIKQEALEHLTLDIKFGFENEDELFESVREMFYDESDFDEGWLREKISDNYSKHQRESLEWQHPTDFERLAKTFDELIAEGIVCLHNAGYTRSDGEGDCMETVERLDELGIKASGFCYYHAQDLGRAVDLESRSLYLGFNSVAENDNEAILIANRIIEKLRENSFKVDWSGTVDQRMEIKDIDWKKVPDDQDWGQERVVRILSALKDGKKPFWKFW
jgi:hypothetical protein